MRTFSWSVHQIDVWLRSCRSRHVCYFDDKLAQSILPHLNLAKIILPPTATAATSVDKTMQFAQFSPDANMLSHFWPFLLRPSACFCTLGVNRGQQRRHFFAAGRTAIGWGQLRQSHLATTAALWLSPARDTVDFWEGTAQKYTSFSWLPTQAINTPKNRGRGWLSSCHSWNLR